MQVPGLGLSVGVTGANPNIPVALNYTVTDSDTRSSLQDIYCFYDFSSHAPSSSTLDVPSYYYYYYYLLYNVNTIQDSDSMIAGSECKGDIEGPSCNTARPKRG